MKKAREVSGSPFVGLFDGGVGLDDIDDEPLGASGSVADIVADDTGYQPVVPTPKAQRASPACELETLTREERIELELLLLNGPKFNQVVQIMLKLTWIPAGFASVSEALFSSTFVGRFLPYLPVTLSVGALAFLTNFAIRTISLGLSIERIASDLTVELQCRRRRHDRYIELAEMNEGGRDDDFLDHSIYYARDNKEKNDFVSSSNWEVVKLMAISASGVAPDIALAISSLSQPGSLAFMSPGWQVATKVVVIGFRGFCSFAVGYRGVVGSRIYQFKLFSDQSVRNDAITIREHLLDFYTPMLIAQKGWQPDDEERKLISQGFNTKPNGWWGPGIEFVSGVTILPYAAVSFLSAAEAWKVGEYAFLKRLVLSIPLILGAVGGVTRKFLLLLGANRSGYNRLFGGKVNILPAKDMGKFERGCKGVFNIVVGPLFGAVTSTGPAQMINIFVFGGKGDFGSMFLSYLFAGSAVFWINGFDVVDLSTVHIPKLYQGYKDRKNKQDIEQLRLLYKTDALEVIRAAVNMPDRQLVRTFASTGKVTNNVKYTPLFKIVANWSTLNRAPRVRMDEQSSDVSVGYQSQIQTVHRRAGYEDVDNRTKRKKSAAPATGDSPDKVDRSLFML